MTRSPDGAQLAEPQTDNWAGTHKPRQADPAHKTGTRVENANRRDSARRRNASVSS